MIQRKQHLPTLSKRPPPNGPLPFHKNAILSKCSDADRKHLSRGAEFVRIAQHDVMYEADEAYETLWFPVNGMVSIVADGGRGSGIEVGAAGYEGMIGFEALLGAKSSPRRQFCQVGGEAITVPIESVEKVFSSGAPQRAFHSFLHAHIIEASQSAVCNRLHTADQRLARWLLATRDRMRSDDFGLTHEFLSQMLGARRSTVSLSANKFKSKGWIHYSRGKLQVKDVKALKKATCECYAIIRSHQQLM